MTPEALTRHLAPVFREYVAQITKPLQEELATLRAQLAAIPAPVKGEPGKDGKDADMAALEKQIDARFDELKRSIPPAEKGKDGRDGVGIVEAMQNKAGELVLLLSDGTSKNAGIVQGRDGSDGRPGENANLEAIRALVAEVAGDKTIDPQVIKSLMPEPVKGAAGERGEQGESAYQIAVRLGFKGSEREWVESLKGERGEPGKDGAPGKDGERGVDGAVGKDGQNGKDAEPVDYALIEEEVKRLVGEVAKSIPEPKDGKDGRDGKDADMAEVFRRLDDAVAKIPAPKDGRDGEPGKSVDPESVRGMIADAVKAAVSGIEQKSIEAQIDPEQLEEIIARHIGKIETMTPDEIKALVAKEIAALPKPKDGKDGKDADMDAVFAKLDEAVKVIPPAKDGKDGRDGKDADMNAVFAQIDEAVKAIPPAKDGRDGKDGKDGADGLGIERPFQNEKGELVLLMTDGKERNVGRIKGSKGDPGTNGRDGKDGANGKDGLGFDDVRLDYDGERSFSFIFERGDDRKKHGPFIAPMLIDRGIYKAGETYLRGDGVTWGGSLWIATKETADKPGSEESGWRLAVKKGRDGKDGKPGERGPEGKSGRPGRDLTQVNPETGEKW